ncbi:MAG: hypothetical protein U9R54_08795, partial [Bacteroidota bacterium]|nr:hypothetical protein [Bacteroidota bacterium]
MRKISSNLSKIVFTLFFLSFSLLLNAQENNTNKRYTKNSLFLLNSFENGIASWHDGKVSKT